MHYVPFSGWNSLISAIWAGSAKSRFGMMKVNKMTKTTVLKMSWKNCQKLTIVMLMIILLKSERPWRPDSVNNFAFSAKSLV